MATFPPESILPPPAVDRLKRFENYYGLKFPKSYIDFLNTLNATELLDKEIHTAAGDFLIHRFLTFVSDLKSDPDGWADVSVVATQLDWGLGESGTLRGLDLVPIAFLFAGNYLVLDYRTDSIEPSVSYWDHEQSEEDSPYTEPVASSFASFLELLP